MIMNLAGLTGVLSDTSGAIASSFTNMLAMAVEKLERSGGVAHKVNPRLLWLDFARAFGPLGGMASNDFANLAISLMNFGFSATGAAGAMSTAAAAIAAGAGAGIGTAGVGLALAGFAIGCDAFMVGAMAAKVIPSDYERHVASTNRINAFRLRAALEQAYQKKMNARPVGRSLAYR